MKMIFSEEQNSFIMEVVAILYRIHYGELATKLLDEFDNKNPKVLDHTKQAYEAIGGDNFTTKKVAAFGLREFVEEEMPVIYDPYESYSKKDD